MTIETLQNRIASKEQAIEKLNKKIERLEKKIATLEKKLSEEDLDEHERYRDECACGEAKYDCRIAKRDLKDAEETLDKYNQELKIAIEKENSRNIQPILDCLEKWKESCIKYYEPLINSFNELYDEMKQLEKNIENHIRMNTNKYVPNYKWEREDYIPYDDEEADMIARYKELKVSLNGTRWQRSIYDIVRPYVFHNNWKEEAKMDLDKEANRKYDDIIERTNSYVGEITDASNLKCASDGNLNGIIVGEKGKVEVFTIIAGGPVQRDHFRVLVKPRK